MRSSRVLARSFLSVLSACALAGGSSPVGAAPAVESHPVPAGMPSPSAVLKSLSASGPRDLGGAPPGAGAGAQRSRAPYFFVAGGDPKLDRLPLKETRAKVTIVGTIAHVVVHQVFANDGSKPIDAVYVFPASTRAAVHAMRMHIGARTVEARIAKREDARAQYEKAKREGKRASLLEQDRPNVFTTSVANIMPKDRIEVMLEYTEMLVPENAVYELVYPTVVGPRYVAKATSVQSPERWTANPHLPAGASEPYKFGIEVEVRAGIPIKEITSPSHPVSVTWHGLESATVGLARPGGGNRDFVLRYRLAGDQIETGLLLWDEPKQGPDLVAEHFFSLALEPPRRPTSAIIPRREYIFLLDVSGSMAGFPLETAKALMHDLLDRLRPTDLVNVALFAGDSTVWSPEGSRQATPENIEEAIALVDRQSGGGGTELMGGLRAAYAIPSAGAGIARTVIVVTDGYVEVEAQAFRFIRKRLDRSNLFAFGIGSSVNRGLIEGMARAGLGEPFVVLDPSKAETEAAKLRKYVERPVLTDIKVRFDGFEAFEVAPEKIPDLLAERPLLLFGKYRPSGEGGRIEVSGRNGRGPWRQVIEVRPTDARPENAALRPLWARKWVEILEDEAAMSATRQLKQAITDLGLAYSLLTPFTSFVAIDSEVVNRGGAATHVRQALPMPVGVPNTAIGSASGVGGVGIVGVGMGGGGTGAATLGMAVFGTIGRAAGGRSVSGYGRAVGGLAAHVALAPRIVMGQASVRGSLGAEVIRRVIRSHINEVRFCYEQELGKHPELTGRVSVQFVISVDGKVTTSLVQSSTLGNLQVETCIAAAIGRWEFPVVKDGGLVIVNYPFVLTPGPARETTPISVTAGS
jgi:Ca-activated chloride channel homolog